VKEEFFKMCRKMKKDKKPWKELLSQKIIFNESIFSIPSTQASQQV
jgi:hypothetical protein